VEALRHTPAPSAGALARATAAAFAAQRAAVEADTARVPHQDWRRAATWAAAVVAAVGLGAGVWRTRGAMPAGEVPSIASAPGTAGRPAASDAPLIAPVVPAGGLAGALDEAPRLVRFTLRAPGASRVALVGDFNRWNPAATPLAGRAGEWEIEVPLTPGRHAYAFVVDGRGWVLDPNAPQERDPDFGRARSVTVVGLEPLP